ncbi:MAG: putative porin [Prolixibacteraceae bacterium]
MILKLKITIFVFLAGILPTLAQIDDVSPENFGSYRTPEEAGQDSLGQEETVKKKKVPSFIRSWKLTDFGAVMEKTELDTALDFFQVYDPIFQKSISNSYTGNLGGAYLSNDYFSREPESDFYFYRSFDVYAKFPESIRFLNTTTPYTLLDYSQSENKNVRAESRFNVYHSQNTNPKFNFSFLYDQAKSTGQYQLQETKFHTIGFNTTYVSDRFNSHFNLLFNRHEGQENGGLQAGQDLNEYDETETYLVNLADAWSKLQNNTVSLTNEYKIGKTEDKKTEKGQAYEVFRPITGLIHQVEYSGNKRYYTDNNPRSGFYRNVYRDTVTTGDTVSYNRFTNIFQLKFYENPDRKFTFSKRAYAGYDMISIQMPGQETYALKKENTHNLFVGGGISRTEGEFWRWNAEGKIYLTGFRTGQTELSAYIYKPLKIGKDTTSLYVAGELNTLVPDHFIQDYRSNHYDWVNRFKNTNEMIIRSRIQSQEYKLTVGLNYALISNYIYNDSLALPNQGSKEMLVLAAYANKDFVSPHWLIRAQLLWQNSGQPDYLHLPALTGFFSLSYKTIISKVLHTMLGFDVRYHTEFEADAYDPATGQFHWQNKQKIGNYPFVDLHANLKLKRTRAFFQLKNAASGFLPGDFWSAPDYPAPRRTFRLGIAWSFYD